MSCTSLIYVKHICKHSLQSLETRRSSRQKLPTKWDKNCPSARGITLDYLSLWSPKICHAHIDIYLAYVQTFITIHWKLEEKFAPQSIYYMSGQTNRPTDRVIPVYPQNFFAWVYKKKEKKKSICIMSHNPKGVRHHLTLQLSSAIKTT